MAEALGSPVLDSTVRPATCPCNAWSKAAVGVFSSFSDLLGFEKVENIVCPVCKTSLKEFKSTSKLGCPNCYEAFRDEISKVIKRIAPFERHSQDTIKTKISKPKLTKEEQIASLREEMKQAVSEERYEDAAKIKKQITKLESANE